MAAFYTAEMRRYLESNIYIYRIRESSQQKRTVGFEMTVFTVR